MRLLFLIGIIVAAVLPQQAAFAGEGAQPFVANEDPASYDRALQCLTQAVYYEARSESEDGQRAVAQVVLNRVRHPAYPNSVCGVVYQGSERSTGCQFTFTCDGSMTGGIEPYAWDRAQRIAAAALHGDVYRPVGLATNYHTTAIRPYWAPGLVEQAVIGAHIFYRRPGYGGLAGAFDQTPSSEEPDIASGEIFASPVTVRRGGRSAGARRGLEGMTEIPVAEIPVAERTLAGRAVPASSRNPVSPGSRSTVNGVTVIRASGARSSSRVTYQNGVRVIRGS
jgi:hypothetical protein